MEWKIIHIDETDSTNRWLRKGLTTDEQSDANMVVVAEYQTAGRGCGTNRWESERELMGTVPVSTFNFIIS